MVEEADEASKPDGDDVASRQHRVSLSGFDNKLCMVDCSRALASLAWLWNKESGDSHFLFGTIDLVPDELPLLDCLPKIPYESLGKKSDWRVYFADHAISSATAVTWYEGFALRGEWGAPWLDPTIKMPAQLGERMLEPRWPHTVVLDSAVIPSTSQRKAATRAHHALVTTSRLQELLEPKEMTALLGFLKEHRQLDLEAHPQLCHSAHLFAPLPILRHYKTSLASDENGDRALFVDLVPRLGQRLDKLTIEVLEKRPTGQRLLAMARASSPLSIIALDEDVEQIATRIVHDEFGLLVDDGPYFFLQSVSITGDMVTEHRRVPLPARGKRPAQLHRIPVTGMDHLMLIGSDRGTSGAKLLRGIALKSQPARTRELHWFRDDPEGATQVLHRILRGVRSRLVVIDPYFTAADVLPYLPWVSQRKAQIVVLTSTKGLQDTSLPQAPGDENGTKAERERRHLDALRTELELRTSTRTINPVSVRVMSGHRPIHDRFLIADEKVWHMGSSLNAFGTRGTMLSELDDAPGMIPVLLQYAEPASSKSLDERLAELLPPASPPDGTR
jgi:hypothetical protein